MLAITALVVGFVIGYFTRLFTEKEIKVSDVKEIPYDRPLVRRASIGKISKKGIRQ